MILILSPTNGKFVINLRLVNPWFLFNFFLNVTLVRDVVKISIVGEINDLVCIVVKAYQTQMAGYVG